jgi:hypothetical protein
MLRGRKNIWFKIAIIIETLEAAIGIEPMNKGFAVFISCFIALC